MIKNIDNTKCTGCGICVEICPLDNLGLSAFQQEGSPCQIACPAGVDIRGYSYLLKRGRLDEAMKLVREALPFPSITGHVCFHPCESECVRKEVDEAININSLERFIADYWLKEKGKHFPRLHVARVAIVGSGPAGLAAAYFLTRMGYRTTVFESMPEPGGMLRVGILDYRLPKNILDAQIDYIRDMGVEFKTETTIGKNMTMSDLRNTGYKAVFFATGTQLSKKLEIDGSEIDGVQWGLDFLRDINLKRGVGVKDRVLVIGGGDVAMDVALAALRLGAKEVKVACLESRKEMPAHKESIRQVKDEGIGINVCWGPKRILGKNGNVSGVELIRCTSVFDKEGRFYPSFNEKTTKSVETDMVICAIGQTPDPSVVPKEFRTTGAGTIWADPVTLETGITGVFAGGDVVSGPSSVVEAIASGKRAAISIDRYLRGEDLRAGREVKVKRIKKQPREGLDKIKKKVRQATPMLPVEQRCLNFKEVKAGFSEEAAMDEVQRCMTCGSKAYIPYDECMTCFQCEMECPYGAIDVDPFKEELPPAIRYDEEVRKNSSEDDLTYSY
jgi:NADPH-dependent glutamate synthase beta subunit-like oxidoreductase